LLEGHEGGLHCCQFFDNGRKALSGGADARLIVWDLTTGELSMMLEGHTFTVSCCAVFDNDQKALSGGYDQRLRVWDLSTGECLRELVGHSHAVRCCAVFADGSQIFGYGTRAASGGSDGTLRIWDLTAGLQLASFHWSNSEVYCCSLFNEGKKVLVGFIDSSLAVVNLKLSTGDFVAEMKTHSNWVTFCYVSDDESIGVSASYDKTMRVWHLSTGTELARFDMSGISCCDVFDNDRMALTGSSDNTLHVWEFPRLSADNYRMQIDLDKIRPIDVSDLSSA
jgi:WD40 repeat protein